MGIAVPGMLVPEETAMVAAGAGVPEGAELEEIHD